MSTLEQRCVNTIRTLSMDAVQRANSGHPGMPMGMADVAFVLWTEFLKHNPANPKWTNRDRFILSAGHGSMLLYSLLHLTGYDLPLDEIKNFRQWGSKTPGHPEYGLTPGVETTTGPLGQGFATGIGMAIAEKHLAAKVNTSDKKIIDHTTFAIVSDGDVMEGVSQEAASIAGHQQLGNIVYLYDDNNITIDGSTDLAFTENVRARFEAYGWHTLEVDGHDRVAIRKAITQGVAEKNKPTLIACKSHIGYGSPNKQDTSSAHGSPLGPDEIRKTKEFYGVDPDQEFHIEDDVLAFFRKEVDKGAKLEGNWNNIVAEFKKTNPDHYHTLSASTSGKVSIDFDALVETFPENPKGIATRKASGIVLDAVAAQIPGIMGGSADLGGSNLTEFKGHTPFTPEDRAGNYMHYGVREHAMGSIMNGMSLHGSVRPFGGTFLVFADYCKPAIRLSALMHQPVVYVFTHDSIGLGEDGPTHQPIEQLASLRSVPNLIVLRPADANETAAAWKFAFSQNRSPVALILTRQNLPEIARTAENDASLTAKGAYIFKDSANGKPDVIFMATGSEVAIAHEAWKKLTEKGVSARVVSMPSWELFRNQDAAYKEKVLPSSVTNRVAIEAASPLGWHEWTGLDGKVLALNHFGESAPFEKLYEEFGLTSDALVKAAGY